MAPKKANNRLPRKPEKTPGFNLTWLFIAIILGLSLYYFQLTGSESGGIDREVSYTAFKAYITNGYGQEVIVDKTSGTARLVIKPEHIREVFKAGTKDTGSKPTISARYPDTQSLNSFLEASLQQGTVKYEENNSIWTSLLTSLLPLALLIGVWVFFMRRMSGGPGSGVFSVGKSKAQLFDKNGDNTKVVTFKDVAGQEGAKQEIREIVDFLKAPGKYTELGGKIPKGALLVGPPGTGKTLLAKAVAGEADVPFFSMAGSDFVEMFVGVGASRVRDLFQKAKEKAPCIVFIDEIDAIGRARGRQANMGSNDERENTLNQLLTEMDGFGTNSGVIILAATNRVDILDPALLRAGRFDRQIHVDLPELSERVAIFKVHCRPLKMDRSLDIEQLARQTPGFSGADIANVCNEAALMAARHNRKEVGKQDFMDAIDRIIGGLERTCKVMTEEEKRTIAIHEAGHAAVSWLLQYANPLVKVTIVPRGQSLGAAWYMPEERSNSTKEQMLDQFCSILGGRAAEDLFIGHISSGALDDLQRVTKGIYAMVVYYGMSPKLLNVSYYNTQQEYSFAKPYSEATAETIDREIAAMVEEQYLRAKAILQQHAAQHRELAELLMEREVIFTEDVERIFGPRRWKSRTEVLMEEEAIKLANERTRKLEAEAATAQAESATAPAETEAAQPEDTTAQPEDTDADAPTDAPPAHPA